MAMNVYNQTMNYDNSVIRYIIVALLAELNKRIYVYQHPTNEVMEKIDIPFFFSVTGGERFLKDEFQYDAINNDKAIGDYERVPRGVINLENVAIDSGSQVNKFTQAKFVHEVDGVLKTFYMRCCFLPINMSFTCNMVCSSQIEMLKVTESILSKLYAVNTFFVDLGMMQVQSAYTLPNDYSQDRPIEFGIDQQKEYKVSFNIEVKSFYPVFENGILLDEINDMIKGKDGSVMMFRSDEYGNVGVYPGGLITKFYLGDDHYDERDIPELADRIKGGEVDKNVITEREFPKTYMESNRDKDLDYTIKTAGYNEPQQNKNR